MASSQFTVSSIKFSLEEQLSDMRSNEVAYKFTIENKGHTSLALLDTRAITPDGVDFSAIRDSSSVALKTQHKELCNELGLLLNTYVIANTPEIHNMYVNVGKGIFEEALGAVSSFWGLYAKLISGSIAKVRDRVFRQSNAFSVKIETAANAKAEFQRWLKDLPPENGTRRLYESKMEQLKKVETKIRTDKGASVVASVEPGSIFTQTYVFRFRRYALDARRANISIEASYADLEEYAANPLHARTYVGNADAMLIVSPQPSALTFLAVVGSWMGVCLQNVIGAHPHGIVWLWSLKGLGTGISSSGVASTFCSVVASTILAIVFYNVYEYTGIGKGIDKGIGISWRGALLVGMLCGLGSDKIVAALRAIIGT